MFKHLLVAIDGSDCAASALDLALDLAKGQQAKLTILSVVDVSKAALASMDPYGGTAVPMLEAMTQESNDVLAAALVKAGAAGVEAQTELATGGMTVDLIVSQAEQAGCDLIVIGSHGRSGFARLALGSVAEGVMRAAKVPTLIVHARKSVSAAAARG